MKRETDWELWREALSAVSLGWDLAVPIFAGVLIGYALDRWLGTRYIFTLGLLMLGIAAGFHNVWRFIRRMEAGDRRRAAQKQKEREQEQDETTH